MEKLMSFILSHRTLGNTFIVGIDGLGGAGKSTISETLRERLTKQHIRVILLHADDFIHPRAVRYNDSLPAWKCYYDLQWRYDYLRDILQEMREGNDTGIQIELYDKDADCYHTEHFVSEPDAVMIVEGVFLQRPELAGCFDCMAYLDIPEPVRLERVLQRDVYIGDAAAIREKYETRYFPAEHHYMEECIPAARADVLIK